MRGDRIAQSHCFSIRMTELWLFVSVPVAQVLTEPTIANVSINRRKAQNAHKQLTDCDED
jgi:hypothetical protein